MARRSSFFLLQLLLLGLVLHPSLAQEEATAAEATNAQTQPEAPAVQPSAEVGETEEEEDEWGLNSLRGSFQAVNGYFDSMLEFLGDETECASTGKAPVPRPDFHTPEPNGCSSYFLGLPLPEGVDMGIPAITKCCNQLDLCYTTCGSNKYRCDSKFRWCLHGICSDLKKSLGFVSKVEACETVADTLFNTVWTLGCRSYMNSQREACLCEGEAKDEL